MSPTCALCKIAAAVVYCVNDDANLCAHCDKELHSSNPLAARHDRQCLAAKVHDADSFALPTLEVSEEPGVVPQMPDLGASIFEDCFPGFESNIMSANPVSLFEDQENLLNLGDFGSVMSDAVVPLFSKDKEEQTFFNFLKNNQAPLRNNQWDSPSFDFAMVPQITPAIDFDNEDFHLAPTKAERRPRNGMAHTHGDPSFRSVGTRRNPEGRAVALDMPEERELTRAERVARWREKRSRRNFQRRVRYESRKAYADVRPRIKGRFVSPEEFAAYVAEHAQVVPTI